MIRTAFALPMLLSASLAAQVPVTPPARVTAPVVQSNPVIFDRMWADELAAQARSLTSNLDFHYNLDFNLASEMHFDALNSLNSLSYTYNTTPFFSWGSSDPTPVAWAQSDPADSLYRMARDQFSRGDYRRAADLFKSLPTRFPNSAYVADAQYYQAFALYRIGGTPELQQALAVLESRKPDEPSKSRNTVTATHGTGLSPITMTWGGNQTDAAGLAARIANVLSSRGLSNDPAVKKALAAGGSVCDRDDQAVRAEALSALMQNDPETGRQMATRILANRDECSVPLRRNAVMLVGMKRDEASTPALVSVVKSDPSTSVRQTAVEYLVRVQTDAAINAVIDVARSDTSKQIQRTAVRALAQSTNARARNEVKAIVENNTADESLRLSVIDGLNGERLTAEDAAWLRTLYTRTTSTRIKQQIISTLGSAGGEANNQWIQSLLRNEDEPLESRTAALRRAGRSMDVATLVRTYDASAQRPIRETVMELLAERKEPEALDKIVDIAKNGTDTYMRTRAIGILSRSKDPRASKLLMQLVDH